LDRTELIKIFLEYNFNIAAEALNYLLQKEISEKVLREILPKIPPDIPVINLSAVEKYLESSKTFIQPVNEKTNNYTQISNESTKEIVTEGKNTKTELPRVRQREQKISQSSLRPSSRVFVELP